MGEDPAERDSPERGDQSGRTGRSARRDAEAISELEPADDTGVPTLRQYVEAPGARPELVAVFDDEDSRVPIHLGRDDAA